jgi:hypothetical protein
MALLVRAATVLLCVALAACSVALQDLRFAFAAAAILCLVELALALRARAGRRSDPHHPSRLAAARVSYTEQEGVLAVTLSGASDGRPLGAPCVVVSRTLRPPPDGTAPGGPRLALSAPPVSIYAAIQEADLSPQLLRLLLDARAAEALGSETVCVTLPAGTDQRLLERALGRILRGVPFTSDRSLPEAEPGMPPRMAS